MPKQKSGTYNHKEYQNEYHKAMKTKLISFNTNTEADVELWEFMTSHDNVTKYIKDLIRQDMAAARAAKPKE